MSVDLADNLIIFNGHMPDAVSDVQGHCKSIVYWESMDLSCNVVWPLPPDLGTVPICIPETVLGGDSGDHGRCVHQ
eukprot:901271-Prorocentrum_lima.AAC.1